MRLRPFLCLVLLLAAPSLCMAADWRLIERFDDLEMFYDASSVRRDRDSVTVTTLVNYFRVRNRGDGEFRSKTTIQTVYCDKEKLLARYSSDYREHFAKGGIVDQGELDASLVDTKPKTVAGEIHAAVCKVAT